jgi:uncharacterized membrane protein
MLREVIASTTGHERIIDLIEWAGLAIEVLAVVIIVVAIFSAVFRYSIRGVFRLTDEDRYRDLKIQLGKALLLGLEILVAADVVRTVALEATLTSVLILGLLVLIRTFLSWALVVELEGRWPWQAEKAPTDREEQATNL